MATSDATRIAGFLAKYLPEISREAKVARQAMRALMPTAAELIYDNYNSLVFGYGPNSKAGDAIFSVVLFPEYLRLFFLQGAVLGDPDGLLEGTGSRVRSVRLANGAEIETRHELRALMVRAILEAKVPLPKTGKGTTEIRAVLDKQRTRRPSATRMKQRQGESKPKPKRATAAKRKPRARR